MMKINIIEKDDQKFISQLLDLIEEYHRQAESRDIFLIKVDNWFDHKGLGYAGKSKIGINNGLEQIDSIIRPTWKFENDVTIPSFNPNRIFEEHHFLYKNNKILLKENVSNFVHPKEHKKGLKVLNNKIIDFSSSGLFVWFSSNTIINRKGSMMLYRISDEKVTGWYASFIFKEKWKVNKVKNMDRDTIINLFGGKQTSD